MPDSIAFNKEAYEKTNAVAGFTEEGGLQNAEAAVFEWLLGKYPNMHMLDIGVGGGRTSVDFGPKTERYVGVDYSAPMIDYCRKAFADAPEHMSFEVCDATDMQMFNTDEFDVSFFSFNGIDSLTEEMRIAVHKECKRVTKPGGTYCFSSHNLLGIGKLYHFAPHRNPHRMWISLRRCALTRLHNPSYKKMMEKDAVIVNEAAHFLKLQNYYIRPLAQKAELEQLGFTDIRAFDGEGNEFTGDMWDTCTDPWIYYTCTIPA